MDSEGTKQLIVFVGLVIAVVGVLANGFVVAAISGDKTMRGNSMYLLLANLAVADLLYLCGSVVTTAFVKHNNLYLRALWSYILQLAIFASICTNVSVCIERYVAVVHSLHFNRLFRPRLVIQYCILLWVLSAAMYIPHYVRQKHSPEIRCSLNEVWKDCPRAEATCENFYTPSCDRYCAPSAYRCRGSYVRTTEGACVERRHCPGGNKPVWMMPPRRQGWWLPYGNGRLRSGWHPNIRSSIKWYWKVYKVLDWLLCFALPITVLSVFYTLTRRRLWSGDSRLQTAAAASSPGSAANQKEEPRVSSRRAVVRMLIICVVVFYVCYAFPSVVSLAETIVDDRPIVTDSMAHFAAVLVVVASSVNPFVYTVLSKSFRERLQHMLLCRLFQAASVSPESTDKSTSNTDSSK